jgi:gas vesicle protein
LGCSGCEADFAMPQLKQVCLEAAMNWWDLVPAMVGAVVGALAAGVPAYLIANKQSKETLKRDTAERLRRDKLAANRVFSKLSQITNEILDLRVQIEAMLKREIKSGDSFPNQRRISVIVGHGEDTINFDADELSIFVSKADGDLINDLELLRRRRNALMVQLAEFRQRKIAHAALLSEATEISFAESGIATMRMQSEKYPKIQFEEAQIESLITPVIDAVREESRTCILVAEKFNAAVARLFPNGIQQFNTTDARAVLAGFGDVIESDNTVSAP